MSALSVCRLLLSESHILDSEHFSITGL